VSYREAASTPRVLLELAHHAGPTLASASNLSSSDLVPRKVSPFRACVIGQSRLFQSFSYFTMSKKVAQIDQIVKLIVGAGAASPSPPVGPALGSKGVKSMDFCKVRESQQRIHLLVTDTRRNSMPEQHTCNPAHLYQHE
jgi:hypothetical protein